MVPALEENENLFLESQALNGVEKWAENFDSITVLFPKIDSREKYPSLKWESLNKLQYKDKITIVTLPLNYGYFKFLKDVFKHKELLKSMIKSHRFNVFSIGGITGDWGAIAALLAMQVGVKFGVWTDRVEHNVVRIEADKKVFLKRFYSKFFIYNLMKLYHKLIIKKSEVGLFHGKDCYNEYSKYTEKSFLVHDIHFKESDQITREKLKIKLIQAANRGYLRICYAGRISEMKGPFEWLEILSKLKKNDINFKAQWMGSGELKDKMISTINELSLSDSVEMLGFISEQEVIKKNLQDSDIFLFCHKTHESPRNLIEALKSACPIIGFYSDYADDLIKDNHGGILVKNFNIKQIVDEIIKLSKNRSLLQELIIKADMDGEKVSDREVFRHRSNIIKENL